MKGNFTGLKRSATADRARGKKSNFMTVPLTVFRISPSPEKRWVQPQLRRPRLYQILEECSSFHFQYFLFCDSLGSPNKEVNVYCSYIVSVVSL